MFTEETPRFGSQVAVFGVALIGCIGVVQANPVPNSPYFTDPQQTFSDDLLLEPFELTNEILCYYKNALIRQFDGEPPYNVLIDPNRCGGSEQAEGRGGNEVEASQFDRGRLEVTSEGGILTGTGHWDLSGGGSAWSNLTSQSLGGADQFVAHLFLDIPSDPYSEIFSVRTDGTDIAIRMEATEPGLSEDIVGYVVKDEEQNSGRGFLEITENGITETWQFGYTEEFYCRMNDEGERCFSRRADEAFSDVWAYRLYELDGSRFNVDNNKIPGMGIQLDKDGTYGWIDYNGVWFPEAATENLGDEEPVTAGGESYTLSYLRYRLDEYINPEPTSLEEISGMPFWVFGDGFDVEVYWDDDNDVFVVTGYDPDGRLRFRSPEVFDDIDTEYELLRFLDEFTDAPHPERLEILGGWAYLIDSNIDLIINSGGDSDDPELVNAIIGGDRRSLNSSEVGLGAGTVLYCESNCVTAASIENYIATGSNPFDESEQQYTVRKSPVFSLEDQTGSTIAWPAGGTNAESDEADGGGRMDLYSEPAKDNPDREFTYALQLGPGWDSYVLFQDGQIQDFVNPQVVSYQVPEDAEKRAGANIFMGFQGENLNVPGSCYDRVTNDSVACDWDSPRNGWRQDFFIPFDEDIGRVRLQDGDDSRDLLVKWVRRSVNFRNAPGVTASSAGVIYGTAGEMTAQLGDLALCDPSDVSADCYIGPFPSNAQLNEAPGVIHGELQSN